MQEAGINLAIGTDGPASNNCLDMFREMFLVTGLAKLREHDAAVMDANDVLYMATTGGAKAMGLSDCDCLAVGKKKADLFLMDLMRPNMQRSIISQKIWFTAAQAECKINNGQWKDPL